MDGRKKGSAVKPPKEHSDNKIEDTTEKDVSVDNQSGLPEQEKSADQESTTYENLNPESSDGKQDDGFQAPPEAGLSALESLIATSKEESSALDIALDPLSVGIPLAARPNPSPGMIAIPTAEEIAAVTGGDRMPKPTIADIEEAMANGGQHAVEIEPDGTVKFSPAIGPHPNGDYGVVVTVSEPMVSGVLGQAELDGETPGEWLSKRVGEYLEQWFFGR